MFDVLSTVAWCRHSQEFGVSKIVALATRDVLEYAEAFPEKLLPFVRDCLKGIEI